LTKALNLTSANLTAATSTTALNVNITTVVVKAWNETVETI
jgi:hypothetical protein